MSRGRPACTVSTVQAKDPVRRLQRLLAVSNTTPPPTEHLRFSASGDESRSAAGPVHRRVILLALILSFTKRPLAGLANMA